MKTVAWVVAAFLVLWAGYEGWAYHERQLGKLEAAVADDVRVNKLLKKEDAALVTRISFLSDSSKAASAAVSRTAVARATSIVKADSARHGTDAAIHAASDATQDSTTRALLVAIGDSLAKERAASAAERIASTAHIVALERDTLAIRKEQKAADSLATVRRDRIDALDRENGKIRQMLPSTTGTWLKAAGVAGVAFEVGCLVATRRLCLP